MLAHNWHGSKTKKAASKAAHWAPWHAIASLETFYSYCAVKTAQLQQT
jgi:hypothetical protein